MNEITLVFFFVAMLVGSSSAAVSAYFVLKIRRPNRLIWGSLIVGVIPVIWGRFAVHYGVDPFVIWGISAIMYTALGFWVFRPGVLKLLVWYLVATALYGAVHFIFAAFGYYFLFPPM